MMNGLFVVQNGHFYSIFTPQREQVAVVFMGYDGQFARDVVALGPITKALAKRWGVPTTGKMD